MRLADILQHSNTFDNEDSGDIGIAIQLAVWMYLSKDTAIAWTLRNRVLEE